MGFGRNGISLRDLKEIREIVNKLDFGGIYSHLFAVDYDDGLEYIDEFK